MDGRTPNRRLTRSIAAFAAVLLASGAALTVAASAAADVIRADAPLPLSVTYVARVCDEYTDVMANKARNNIMESLRDLGPDSNYDVADSVDPDSEAAGSPNCRPLQGWTFSLGRGLTGKTEAAHYLSKVTGPFIGGPPITTTASVPRLDEDGQPTGGEIEGAVTVGLTPAEAEFVQSGRRIVAQGGVGDDTLNGLQTSLGFAALRCSNDALNGDNVDYISFPSGARHVFCYYYAVAPPPDAGTITIRKQLADGTAAGPTTFSFEGSLSYDHVEGEPGQLQLTASPAAAGSVTLVRGAVGPGDEPWTLEELPLAGWLLDDLQCTGGASTFDISGPRVEITLAPDDDVVCTYTNSRVPTGPAALYKETLDGVGSFPFTVSGPSSVTEATAVTTVPGAPVEVVSTAGAAPGVYTAQETLPPPNGAGRWTLEAVNCDDGELVPVEGPGGTWSASYEIVSGQSTTCLFTNRFIPTASLSIEKITNGGTGLFEYDVVPVNAEGAAIPRGAVFTTSATTTEEGVATPAEASLVGINVFEHQMYTILESLPAPSSEGFWRMTGADCGGAELGVDVALASATVAVNTETPNPVCTFTNEFVPAGTLTITKNTSDDEAQRPDPVVLRLDCGVGIIDISIGPGTSTATSSPYRVLDDDECTLTEIATGAADGWSVVTTATISVNGGPPEPFDELGTFAVGPALDVVVIVDNTFSAVPPPTPTPTPGGDPSPPSSSLAESGVEEPTAALAVGLAMLVLGAALLGAVRRRRAG
ncbi:hypothetical protein ACFVTX_08850 [Agromyces sp. NPDC058136]|uniref:prealbumin-like fold domain-containing protein n=1 Tax=Agromyces sp. NPDC058136 TaxID=3346354 RepID=UPI0036D9AD8F